MTCKKRKKVDYFYVHGVSVLGILMYHAHCIPCTNILMNKAKERRLEKINKSLPIEGKCTLCGETKLISEFRNWALLQRCKKCQGATEKRARINRKANLLLKGKVKCTGCLRTRLSKFFPKLEECNRCNECLSKADKIRRAKNKERDSAKRRAWYALNAERERRRASDWAKKHPELVKEIRKKYWKTHKDESRIRNIAWRKHNPEKHRAIYLRGGRRARETLSDPYVKNQLVNQQGYVYSEIPDNVVEMKRAQMDLTRAIREKHISRADRVRRSHHQESKSLGSIAR